MKLKDFKRHQSKEWSLLACKKARRAIGFTRHSNNRKTNSNLHCFQWKTQQNSWCVCFKKAKLFSKQKLWKQGFLVDQWGMWSCESFKKSAEKVQAKQQLQYFSKPYPSLKNQVSNVKKKLKQLVEKPMFKKLFKTLKNCKN